MDIAGAGEGAVAKAGFGGGAINSPPQIRQAVLMPRERVISGSSAGEQEEQFNYALRPRTFAQYIGQESLIRKLKIAVDAAKD